MTDLHWFQKPTGTDPGTINPVFELLDHPIAMGRAEEVVLVGPAPERPLVNGREVSDPRLITALTTPIELGRAEALDRSAKLAGIFRAMGLDPRSTRLTIDPEVPELAAAISQLAAARIGMVVDRRVESSSGSDDAPTLIRIHPIEIEESAPGRTSVKVVRSRFEGVGVSVAGQTANLDQAMRDSRVESAEVVPLAPDTILVLDDGGDIDAEAAVPWLAGSVLSGERA